MDESKSPNDETNGSSSPISLDALREEFETHDLETESEAVVSRVVSEVEAELFGNESISYEENCVKSTLDELLVALISLRRSDAHGQQLLDDLTREFDTTLNSGTIYSHLDNLCEKNRLERHDLVRTKTFVFNDVDAARNDVVAAVRQHLAFAMVFIAALEYGEFGESGHS